MADHGTTGWFIWAGETFSQDPDLFVPPHAEHLKQWAPMVLPYLALPTGWRFLIAEGYEDVWDDPSLIAY
ncbi:immunity protein Imm33 domain-containing protein [Paraburkholderia terrae]|uniref:immunity protein Imm33 domain-containing protein n=1 Tax=Paraburkholderia terrae TaxID=311230 RepID=UPI003B849F51